MPRATLLVPLVLAASAWPVDSQAIGNLGGYRTLGYTSCAEYARDHAAAARDADGALDRESGRFAAHAGFVLGYLSAFNAWVVNDIVDITDHRPFDALFDTLAEQCRALPDIMLVDALESLVSELWATRDPTRVGKPPWSAGTAPAE